MLGTRGVRLGILLPGDLRDAGRGDLPRRAARERGVAPHVEVMIPLVDYERELELMRELVERVGGEEGSTAARTTRSAR